MSCSAGLASAIALIAFACTGAVAAPAAAPDSLAGIVARWRAAVGHTPGPGVHLHSRARLGGVPATIEAWITRDSLRTVTIEDRDRAEWVRRGPDVWLRDWNGKTRALAGRDRADGITDAFLRALIYTAPSAEVLAQAHATVSGQDSTGTLRVIRLAPPGGVACELLLDARTGFPVRAVRKPYDDAVVIEFRDWRSLRGAKVPWQTIDIDREGNADTTTVLDATPLTRGPPLRFARPADGPSDVRFASGDRALGIPFDFSNDHIMIECRVNDSKPIWFLLDTGAEFNVLNTPRLAELGLTGFGASTTSGGGGGTGLTFTHVDRMQIGGVTLLGQREGVVDLSGLEKLYGMPMGGLLGMDFIDRFTLHVDYDRHVIDLYTPGDDAGIARGTRVPFIIEEGHPHVAGAVVVDDAGEIPADFIIDSGAAESANLTMPFVRDHHLLERARRTPAPAASITPGTEKQWYTQTTVRGRLRTIRIGDVSVQDIPVNLQQGTSGAYSSPSFSATIGERILSRFNTTYDYTHSTITLDPDTAFARPFPDRTTFGLSLVSDGADYTRFSIAGVRKGSPADSAGFQKGDVIASLDGKPASAWRLATLRAALTQAGAHHRAEIQRGSGPATPLEFTVHVVSIEN